MIELLIGAGVSAFVCLSDSPAAQAARKFARDGFFSAMEHFYEPHVRPRPDRARKAAKGKAK